jgi:drug/metabolite transporter (DMT)-like permease
LLDDSVVGKVETNDPKYGQEPGKEQENTSGQKTLLKPEVERHLSETHPETISFLTSMKGFLIQYGIVGFTTFLAIYDTVLKSKAGAINGLYKKAAKDAAKAAGTKATPELVWTMAESAGHSDKFYDSSMISLWNAVLSIVIGLVLCAKNGTFNQLFAKDKLKMALIFLPAALGFGISQVLGFLVLTFIDADVTKVLDQLRLPVTALSMMVLMGRKYSKTTWCALVAVTIGAVVYSQVKKLDNYDNEIAKLNEKIRKAQAADARAPDTEDKTAGDTDTTNFIIGLILALTNVLIMVLSGVYAEKYMKKYKATPFYIQKIFLELPNIFLQLLFSYVVNPLKGDHATGSMNGSYNPFYGWIANPYVILLFLCFFTKSYLQGILVKRMSSLVKQISQVVAVCSLYFFTKIHDCASVEDKIDQFKSFWCFGDLKACTGRMIMIDLVVFACVMCYVFSGSDTERMKKLTAEVEMYKKGPEAEKKDGGRAIV